MSTQVPTYPAVIDVLDTFYAYISQQVSALNTALGATQQLLGIVEAQDWPQIEVDTNGGLYLLYLSSVPVGGTESQIKYEHFVQWVWCIMGADIASNVEGMNRASRWRSNMQIQEILRQAHFPGFCPKQASTLNNTSGAVTFTTYDPIETIVWTRPKMVPRNDNQRSGLLYGVATLSITAYSDVYNSVVNP